MDCKILIATSNHLLGKQISQELREAGYPALLTGSAAEAAYLMRYEKCPVAVLDCGLPDPGPAYLANEMHGLLADLRVIFIQTEEGLCEQTEVNALDDIYLPTPFYMSDLLEVIRFLIAGKIRSANEIQMPDPQSIPSELAWLQEVNRAAQYLTRLSLEIDAQAALIIQNDHIWAYAGVLSQNAVEELTKYIGHHWADGNGSDLARFVRLETTDSEFMLYVTNLGSGFILALSFETEMPFSMIRSQTGEMVRKLTSPLQASSMEIDNIVVSESPNESNENGDPDDIDWVQKIDQGIEEFVEKDWSFDDASYRDHLPTFEELLASQDLPDPEGSKVFQKAPSVPTLFQPIDAPASNKGSTPEIHDETQIDMDTPLTQDTDPEIQSDVNFKSGSPALHDLAYACLLIPRMPDHHLTGDLAELLNVDMARLCLAYSWRLDHLAVRPLYLHWVVTVTPEVSASQVIQQIRVQTSALIFDEFPRLLKVNPSGDFWAPGFMVTHGRRFLAGSLVKAYIQQTRNHQGIKISSKRENHA